MRGPKNAACRAGSRIGISLFLATAVGSLLVARPAGKPLEDRGGPASLARPLRHETVPAPPRPLPEIGVRNAHAMAYDSDRKRVMLFGGADATQVLGDTWEWDGRSWTRVSTGGPGPRTFAAMTCDGRRNKTVLFGGNRVLFGRQPADNVFLADTWEWDGRSWVRVAVTGPSPRAEAAIAFDAARGRVVLFGGNSRGPAGRLRLGDTWEWDGRRWTEVRVEGPSPRSGAAAAYDGARRRVVLFGGSTSAGLSDETWEWNGESWRRIGAARAESRFNSAMAYDAGTEQVIRFGGRHAGRPVGDTWRYDGTAWEPLGTAGPTPRNHTAMAYDSNRGRIVLFGGHDLGLDPEGTNVLGDTWEWDGKRWQRMQAGESRRRVENGH